MTRQMTADFYERALARMMRLSIAVGVLGTIAILILKGLHPAGGFLLGAAISVFTLRSWDRLAASLGVDGKRPASGSAVFLAIRYPLIAGAVYAIVRFLEITPAAVFMGLLVVFAAVVLEVLYELIYVRA